MIRIHQLAPHTARNIQMNSFVIETGGGHIVVIDGGNKGDALYLLGYLHALGGAKPVIDAWFLTHAHSDHVDAFMELMTNYRNELDVKRIYYNFPDSALLDRLEPTESHTIHEFNAIRDSFEEIHTCPVRGDQIQVGEVVFSVLADPTDGVVPESINDTSLVLRMVGAGQSVLFLADLGLNAGRELLAAYGSALKSDMVQMAHHGQNGVGQDVYAAIDPAVCIWCTPEWLWNNDAGKGYNTHSWLTVEVRRWMDEMNVKKHYVYKNGTQVICLPMAFSQLEKEKTENE